MIRLKPVKASNSDKIASTHYLGHIFMLQMMCYWCDRTKTVKSQLLPLLVQLVFLKLISLN